MNIQIKPKTSISSLQSLTISLSHRYPITKIWKIVYFLDAFQWKLIFTISKINKKHYSRNIQDLQNICATYFWLAFLHKK